MKTKHFTPVLLVIAALIGACSSMPKSTSLLDQTRSEYQVAQSNPQVANYARLEIKQAGDALEQANAAARHDDSTAQIDKLAYLAKQKIALAEEVAKRRSAEAEVANAGAERDRLRLEMRTKEADQANSSAERARLDALLARDRAAQAERQTAVARGNAAEAEARTASLEAQLAELAAKKTERGLVITLGDVLFGVDQTHLTPDGTRTVQKLASILEQHPERSVLIEGFTDSTGTNAYNQGLSERRATTVRNALQDMGVARDRVSMRGYGEAFPVAANDTKQNRQLNRRVEIVVSNGDGQIPPR